MTGRRRGVLIGLVAVAAAAAASVLLTRASQAPSTAAASAAAPTSTVAVVRTTLRSSQQYYGTLDYGPAVTIANAAHGQAFTWLPQPDAVIRPGQPLYEVDGRAVPLLAGSRPMWRALAVGDPDGPDIAQLNTDLVALGYGTGWASGIAGSPSYDWRTRIAVENWQAALGVPVTGAVEVGQLAFAAAPLRVAGVSAILGAPAEAGLPVLTATAPGQVVELGVPVDRSYLVHRNDHVTVTMPDAVTQVPGTVTDVSAAAAPAAAGPSGAPPGNGGPPAAANVTVTVRLANSAAAARFTSAPVSVAITTEQATNVLAVPVSALLARPGGGYALTVAGGAGTHEVAVTTGLYSDTLVEVSGTGVNAGTTVVVPAS